MKRPDEAMRLVKSNIGNSVFDLFNLNADDWVEDVHDWAFHLEREVKTLESELAQAKDTIAAVKSELVDERKSFIEEEKDSLQIIEELQTELAQAKKELVDSKSWIDGFCNDCGKEVYRMCNCGHEDIDIRDSIVLDAAEKCDSAVEAAQRATEPD